MKQNRVQKEMYTYVIFWSIITLPMQTLGERMVFSIKGTDIWMGKKNQSWLLSYTVTKKINK